MVLSLLDRAYQEALVVEAVLTTQVQLQLVVLEQLDRVMLVVMVLHLVQTQEAVVAEAVLLRLALLVKTQFDRVVLVVVVYQAHILVLLSFMLVVVEHHHLEKVVMVVQVEEVEVQILANQTM